MLKYDKVRDFYNGYAAVCVGDKWGFINSHGKEICELKYNYIKPVEFDYGAVVVKLGDKYGYIDIDGNVIDSIKYDGLYLPIYFAEDGVTAVEISGKWGVINKQGEEVRTMIYDNSKEAFESIGVKIKGVWL